MVDACFLRARDELDGKRALSHGLCTPRYKVQRMAGSMSDTVLEAAMNVSPLSVAAHSKNRLGLNDCFGSILLKKSVRPNSLNIGR